MLVGLLAVSSRNGHNGDVNEVARRQASGPFYRAQVAEPRLFHRLAQRHRQRITLPWVPVTAHLLEPAESLVPPQEHPGRCHVDHDRRSRHMQRLGS